MSKPKQARTPNHPAQLSSTFADTAKLIGDFWTLRVIGTIAEANELRFGEIERTIGNICPATLTNRLKKLEDSAIIVRSTNTLDRQSVTYALTDKGKDILPILNAIRLFNSQHLRA